MDSFGFWYKTQDGLRINDKEEIEFELHINLWDFTSKKDKRFPCIDIGIKVFHYNHVEKIVVYCPFDLDSEERLIDLTKTVKIDNPIANLIFNDDCSISGGYGKTQYVNIGSKEKLRLYAFDDPECKPKLKREKTNGASIEFDISPVHTSDSNREQTEVLYIRFRICSDKIDHELFCNIEQKNLFLESAFEGTRIVDIKVNKRRNIDRAINETFKKREMRFIQFNKVHFLLIEPADSAVEFYGEGFSECRRIEPEWKSYLWLDNNKHKMPELLAYHWKAKGDSTKASCIQEYSNTVKVRRLITTWWIIIGYIVVAVIIGIISSCMYEQLTSNTEMDNANSTTAECIQVNSDMNSSAKYWK